MKNLSVKDLVLFRSKSDRSKQNFVNGLRVEKEKVQTEGGGDYWVICLSAISAGYKLNNIKPILNKKEELEDKIEKAELVETKKMYRRNIDVLNNYEDFDFATLLPKTKVSFLKKKKDSYTVVIKGIPIKVTPHYVFTFNDNDLQQVGAIWFIAKLNGFTLEDLGMFADILHKYLKTHFAEQYIVSNKYCIAVDVFNATELHYSQLDEGKVNKVLELTIDSIKRLI